jgi:hypothetical protein
MQQRFGSDERIKIVLECVAARCKAYLSLVTNLETQKAYTYGSLGRIFAASFCEFVGAPPEEIVSLSPEMERKVGEIRSEIAHWQNEGFKRILPKAKEDPNKPADAVPHQTAPSRKMLVDAYFAMAGEKIKKVDMCWAAGQRYREFKRWISGESKDGSKPDIAFRAILTSGKRPAAYRKEARPSKWQ